MTFGTIDYAREWAKRLDKMIYVEIEHVSGVLQVYPGGRTVFYGGDLPRFDRYRKRLTPDKEFIDKQGRRP